MTTKKERYQKVGYYPGCALEGSGHAYNRSTKEVGKALADEHGAYDLVSMSNILDMAAPDQAPEIVKAVASCVRPGGTP